MSLNKTWRFDSSLSHICQDVKANGSVNIVENRILNLALFVADAAKIKLQVKYQISGFQRKPSIFNLGVWRNGSRDSFRNYCLRAWGFDSSHTYYEKT